VIPFIYIVFIATTNQNNTTKVKAKKTMSKCKRFSSSFLLGLRRFIY